MLGIEGINVTRHEKIGLMYTKYTLSHYSTYLTFPASYTSSVNCIKFPIVCFPILVSKVLLLNYVQAQSYETSKFVKVVKLYVHISPIFSCWVTYHVQPVPYVTECNACMQSGWDSVQINSNVQLNCIKIHFINV